MKIEKIKRSAHMGRGCIAAFAQVQPLFPILKELEIKKTVAHSDNCLFCYKQFRYLPLCILWNAFIFANPFIIFCLVLHRVTEKQLCIRSILQFLKSIL